jgi:aldose 1-epimerase
MNKKVNCREWGQLPDGRPAQLYTITGAENRRVSITNYGGIITSIIVPDKTGCPGDIVLGYDTLNEYLRDNAYFGATLGRFANRIAGAAFTLNGREYQLTANEGRNTLHGGHGFNTKLWDAEMTGSGVRLHYISLDGEDGFPGNLEVTVDVTLKDELKLEFTAVSDKDTVVSLTNHTYFNLKCRGNVLSHILSINADKYLTVDNSLIPINPVLVKNGDFDFRTPRKINEGFYDHAFILNDGNPAAVLYEPESGRTMELHTDMPCLQFYASGNLNERRAKSGAPYKKYSGLALEPQHFPDSPNRSDFPSPLLRAGETYHHFLSFKFGCK